MIDPFQIAVNGLGPGFTIFQVALMGFDFIEIIISDQPSGKGPLFRPPFSGENREDDKYLTIRIKLKDNEIVQNYRISNNQARITIKLFENIKYLTSKTSILINNLVLKPVKRIFKINIKDQTNK